MPACVDNICDLESVRGIVEPTSNDGASSTTSAAGREIEGHLRTWLAVLALAFGAAVIVMTEFVPVGFLPEVASDLDISLGLAGTMVLVPGLGAALSAPAVVVAAGRLDRRLMIVLLTVLVVLSNGLGALAPNFAVLLGARLLLGIAIGGFWGVVPPLGARLAGREAGIRATSVILAGLSVGTVIGLPAGQLLGDLIGWRATFGVVTGVAVAALLAQAALLPGLPASGGLRFAHLGAVLRMPIARTTLIVGGIVTIGQFSASTFVTPFLLERAGLGSGPATALLFGYGVAGIGGTLAGAALVARSRIGAFTGASVTVGLILIALPLAAGAPPAVSALCLVWGLAWGVVPLALQTLMLTAAHDTPEASAAVLMSLLQLGIAVGSAVGGLVVDSTGLTVLFVVSGAVAVAAGILATVRRNLV
ncbi:MFS transporter [Streptomyces sp. NPDC056192]|uniref:MFS transporter n=1 Tax=Streptomyces sp. NPDC056192 TaxID=3345743 RepID=UPI0035DF78D3